MFRPVEIYWSGFSYVIETRRYFGAVRGLALVGGRATPGEGPPIGHGRLIATDWGEHVSSIRPPGELPVQANVAMVRSNADNRARLFPRGLARPSGTALAVL